MKKFVLSVLMASLSAVSFADTLEDARRLVVEGDYWQARRILDKIAASSPKAKSAAQYSYLLGACEYEAGNYKEAQKLLSEAKKKGVKGADLYLGRLAFLDYDFEKAQELYGDFRAYVEKSKTVGLDAVKDAQRELNAAENALQRVENIVVIDSLALPADSFFKAYRLPGSSGKLLLPFEIPFEEHQGGAVAAFINEAQDYMMWGEPDSVGNVRLVESNRLLDGTWQEPQPLSLSGGNGGYSDYPFMMPDGTTLYFASTGDESMGGYDIFVASRDPQTGEYLQPQNIGMPFNSPYDDYMLAIDEENGVGWWATDRNSLDGMVTVYVYIVNDLRKNYSPEDPDLLSKARLTDYRSTQNPDEREKYSELLSTLDGIDPDRTKEEPDFMLPVGNGQYYKFFGDFKKPAAREAMKKYLASEKKYASTISRLHELYERYPVNRAHNIKTEILKLEDDLEKQRDTMISNRSDVYRLEKLNK